ncbi:hypothetical protein DL764_011021 [Monosporascus ibericus]|uniref:2EXR domain-containing protein n=1 Tax=Monosporascus ibericus TaxID=155417 RepID=A0A4Q4SRN0_9PEZI|nr:hypothetical protein DL764_011021 [Monosporascus ibericus]
MSSTPLDAQSRAAFEFFPRLPAELRLEIWRLSCSERVVEVFYDSDEDRCLTTSKPPAILHTCRESRNEGLRIFRKSFGTTSHEPRIYFCPELDTLYLPRPALLGYGDHARDFTELVGDTGDVIDLAIDYVDPAIRQPWETYNKFVLMESFPKVKEVFLVVGSDHSSDELEVGPRTVQLVDPQIDAMALDDLLASVKESFSYEVGVELNVDLEKKDPQEQIEQGPTPDVKTPTLMPLPPVLLKSKVVSAHA